MKRKIGLILLFSLICLTIFIVWYSLPKEVNMTFNGYLYGLGDKKQSVNGKVDIIVKGKLRKKIFNHDRFKGLIEIKGDVPHYIRINQKEVEIVFDEDNSGLIVLNNAFNWLNFTTYGTLYINNKFSQLTILIFKNEANESNGWSAGDGMMISAPANTREEALSISNHLMKKMLTGGGKTSLEDFSKGDK